MAGRILGDETCGFFHAELMTCSSKVLLSIYEEIHCDGGAAS